MFKPTIYLEVWVKCRVCNERMLVTKERFSTQFHDCLPGLQIGPPSHHKLETQVFHCQSCGVKLEFTGVVHYPVKPGLNETLNHIHDNCVNQVQRAVRFMHHEIEWKLKKLEKENV